MDSMIKLALTAVWMALLIVRRVKLIYVMSTAALALGLLFGLGPLAIVKHILLGLLSPATITLVLTLAAVMVLERVMEEQEIMQRLVDRAQEALPDPRVAVATLPAFMGLLPSLGGAVISCPMVDQASVGLAADAERKGYLNYWFRHSLEYWVPLYPGVVLVGSILKMDLGPFITWGLPFSLFTVVVGTIIGFHGLKSGGMELTQVVAGSNRWQAWVAFLKEAWPITTIIGLVLIVKINVALATGLVLLILFVNYRYSKGDILHLLRALRESDIILTIMAIMAFRSILEASGAVSALPEVFAAMGISPLVAIMALPFFAGLLTGSSSGLVGISFPLIHGLLAVSGTVNPKWAALAYAAGKSGLMLSPLHLCFPLSTTYFSANAGKVWLRVAISEAVVLGLGIALYLYVF